jgi:signal transduction histidine kinase
MTGIGHMRQLERWIAWVRLGSVAFALMQVSLTRGYPPGYESAAFLTTGVLAAGAVVIFVLARRDLTPRIQLALGVSALLFDLAIVSSFLLLYSWQAGAPTRQVFYFVLVEAAVRFGRTGALAVAVLSIPFLVTFEFMRSDHANVSFRADFVTFQFGGEVILGLIVGWLVARLGRETELSDARAVEAEELRDTLGRRVDILEAANRCARALGSSLEIEEAFAAFIREVRGLVPFERIAVILVEGDRLEVLAAAGTGVEAVFPPGSSAPITGSIFEAVATGRTVYRRDMRDQQHPEEAALLELGLRSRLSAPLLVGATPVGLISFVRREPDAFTPEEVELVSLIGRLAATAVQNIRAYDAERRTVEELRRLSALRADFVSLVSHELRSPMAAVIGSARTLQQRWRELSPDQRESFLALIADETGRLAELIGDVLDTSRIEAGTFSYAFDDVDLGELAEEAVASATVGQEEVPVTATVRRPVPTIRGDKVRLRQVLGNLIDNAVKYSNEGDEVRVEVSATNGRVVVDVRDRGPGIARDQQRLIFEKFGRVKGGTGRPGTGLGLFIARSIAEAHGGTVDVRSVPGEGATFTLVLPAAKSGP